MAAREACVQTNAGQQMASGEASLRYYRFPRRTDQLPVLDLYVTSRADTFVVIQGRYVVPGLCDQ